MKKKPNTKVMNRLMPGSIPLLLLMFFTGISYHGTAQQVTPAIVCSGGETLTASSLSLDFTIGEITTESMSTGSLLLTQGFNQGADPNTGVEENLMQKENLVIYPNPATTGINLLLKNTERKPVNADIRDLQGRIIFHSDFNFNPLLIHLEKLAPGFYTVTVLLDNRKTINKKFIKQ